MDATTKKKARGTLRGGGANLQDVADMVVRRFGASPAAVVGAALRTAPAPAAGVVGAADGWRFGWGAAGRRWERPPAGEPAEAPPAGTEDFFDLASLTKPIVASVFARLARRGLVGRQEALGDVLPEARGTVSEAIPLDWLMAHRAGLMAHVEFFVKRDDADQAPATTIYQLAANGRREGLGEPASWGHPPVYSDLGYILVGGALAARAGKPLDALVREEIADPLGLRLGSVADLRRQEGLSPTAFLPTEDVPWRGGVLRARVHDENAWVVAGEGTAGHAGLFGDVWSVVRFGAALLEAFDGRSDAWLRAEDVLPLVAERPAGSHAAGFDRRSGPAPSSGGLFGPATFGHLGFTGTSLWIDPDPGLVGVLLTNRVHPSRRHVAIRAARPAAYDALYRRMRAKPEGPDRPKG